MKQISYILMTIGGTVTVLGAMCDAEGIYYSFLIATIAVALFLVITGMWLYEIDAKREQKRRTNYYSGKKKDKLDADIEFIDLDKKIAP